MALKIRLARAGTKKRPFYRIVIAEATAPRDGRFVERVGSYDPRLPHEHTARVVLKSERLQHWLKVGAQPTERVALLLGKAELAPMPKRTERPKKSAPKKKAQEKAEAEAAKLKEAAEKKAAAEQEAAEKKAAEAEAKKQAAAEAKKAKTEEAKADKADTTSDAKDS